MKKLTLLLVTLLALLVPVFATAQQQVRIAGPWWGGASQMHDDGSLTEINIDYIYISTNTRGEPVVSGSYEVVFYDVPNQTITTLEHGTITGTVTAYPDGDRMAIQLHTESDSGTPDHGLVSTLFLADDHSRAIGVAGGDKIGPAQFWGIRTDWFFGINAYGPGRPANTSPVVFKKTTEAARARFNERRAAIFSH
jgi:hypothetical protein